MVLTQKQKFGSGIQLSHIFLSVQLSLFLSLAIRGVGARGIYKELGILSCVVLYQQQAVPSCENYHSISRSYSIVQYRFLTMFLEEFI